MISGEFSFHAPTTVDEAITRLDEAGPGATVLAGGMSLLPTMNLGLARPEAVVSLNRIAELAYVREGDGVLHIGSMTRHRELEDNRLVSAHCAVLAEAARTIGDVQIRNRGTIGGSVAHADPAGDYLPVLAALGATVVVRGVEGERRIGAREFVVDIMRTELAPGELLTEIEMPKLAREAGAAFARLSRVEGAFAIVNAAAHASNGTATVAVGGATAAPIVVEVPTDDEATTAAADAAYAASEDAFGDLSGSAEYRREMTRVFAGRALERALDAAG